MSDVGDALTGGGSSASGATNTGGSFGDTPNLTDADFAGLTDADIMGGSGGPSPDFNTFSSIANALSGGGAMGGASPQAAQTAAMTPPSVAAATGGDPAGAAGGTQSSTQPGGQPQQTQSQGGGGQQGGHDPDHAPPSAVAELRALLKGLSGQPTGPTGPIPHVDPGETGARSPPASALRQLLSGASPAAASLPPVVPGETGAQSPGAGPGFPGSQPGGAADLPAVDGGAGQEIPFDPKTGSYTLPPGAVTLGADGNPVTAAGTPAADTPLPPARPTGIIKSLGGDPAGDQTDRGGGVGHDLTVQPRAAAPTADLPTKTGGLPLPTHKGGPAPVPADTGPSRLIQDITGASTGAPTALADLAKIALPLLLPLIMSGLGGGGRRGGFHGGRFTHGVGRGGFNGFRGGMNAMRYHGGRHPMAPGAWPYHHPMHGWHFHGSHPGPGWLPLNPMDAQKLLGGGQGGGQQGGADPNAPPKESDAPYSGETEPAGDGPWKGNPFLSALVGAESGGHQGPGVRGDGGKATGYYQIQTPTWGDFAPRVPGAAKFAKAEDAPANVQQAVASIIPVQRFGQRTKDILHGQFGQFDERMTVGQLSERFANHSTVSGLPRSVSTARQIPTTLPVTSQPMVSGG